MATLSNILAWRIPWREESGGLQSTGSYRVGHNWSDLAHMYLPKYAHKPCKDTKSISLVKVNNKMNSKNENSLTLWARVTFWDTWAENPLWRPHSGCLFGNWRQNCHPLIPAVSSLRTRHLRHMCLLATCGNLHWWWPSSQISRSLSFLCYLASYRKRKKALWPVSLPNNSRFWTSFFLHFLNISSLV